jgi:hypothetical protein
MQLAFLLFDVANGSMFSVKSVPDSGTYLTENVDSLNVHLPSSSQSSRWIERIADRRGRAFGLSDLSNPAPELFTSFGCVGPWGHGELMDRALSSIQPEPAV